MPFIALQTNVEVKDRQALVAALSSAAGASVGKPEAVVSAQVAYNPDMMFAGTNAPNAIISMTSIGSFSTADDREKVAAALFKFVEDHLQVPNDRMYIQFSDPGPDHVAFKGTTIAALRAKQAR